MVSITKNLKEFIEEYNEEIYIYGAGNSGYWFGYYMNLCDIHFVCYLDQKVDHPGCLFNEKPIFIGQDYLKRCSGKNIRILISSVHYANILTSIIEWSLEFNFSCLCYLPVGYEVVEMDHSNKILSYNINIALSYFRKKLYKGKVPTILSNDCTAGAIYQALGMPMASPTVNVGLTEKDFIKLCKNPKHYFGIEISKYEYGQLIGFCNGKPWKAELPCSKIDDITVYWAHSDEDGRFINRWNILRKKVNYDNLICCMSNNKMQFTKKGLDEFSNIKSRKLIIMYKDKYSNMVDSENIILANRNFALWNKDTAIENNFDLIGWVNGDK